MKKILIICILTLVISAAFGQKKQLTVNKYIEDVLFTYPNAVLGVINFNNLPRPQQTLLFSVIIQIGSAGEVKMVDYTNKTPRADSIMLFKNITKKIKSDEKGVLKSNKKTIFIQPVWWRKSGEVYIETGPEFIKSFDELIPDESTFPKGYKIKYLRTLIVSTSDIRMH